MAFSARADGPTPPPSSCTPMLIWAGLALATVATGPACEWRRVAEHLPPDDLAGCLAAGETRWLPVTCRFLKRLCKWRQAKQALCPF